VIRPIDRSVYSRLAAIVTFWLVGIHLVGWAMGQVFRWRVGFEPVWFFDCTACIPVGPAVPSVLGPIARISLFVVIGLIVAALVSRGLSNGLSARTHQVLCAVGGASLAVFGLIAFSTRYPGSLPSVLIGVIPAAVAASLFVAGAGPVDGQLVGPLDRSSATGRQVIAWWLAVVSLILLGGLISVAAVIAGALAWEDAPTARGQRYAAVAVLLGVGSAVLRWTLLNRYSWLGIVY